MAFLEFVFGKNFDVEANVFTLNLEGKKTVSLLFLRLRAYRSRERQGLSKLFLLRSMLINHRFHSGTHIEFMMAIVCPLQLGVLKGFVTGMPEMRIILTLFELRQYKITEENKMQSNPEQRNRHN